MIRGIWRRAALWLTSLCLLTGCAAPGSAARGSSLPRSTDAAQTAADSLLPAPPETTPTGGVLPETDAPVTALCPTASTAARPESDAETRLARMSTEERVAQLFVVTPEALTGDSDYLTAADDRLREAYGRIPAGGFLLMGGNLKDPAQTRALLGALQDLSRERLELPVFLCVDEEGGSVARISGNPAFGQAAIPSMAAIGAAGDPEQARQIGRTMGAYLSELGFNVDLAPDADVLTNPDNSIVRSRSFGSDGALVAEMAAALAEGLLEQGVLPCYKHFPGHGGTAEDSHKGFAVLHRSREALLNGQELIPFADAARRGMPMIMAGHISVPELTGDDLPASLSGTLIGLLRGPELGYNGLVITDALSMKAVSEQYAPGEAAVLAVLAGSDLLLVSDELEESYEAVLRAVEDGTIPLSRIDESVLRILTAKEDLP